MIKLYAFRTCENARKSRGFLRCISHGWHLKMATACDIYPQSSSVKCTCHSLHHDTNSSVQRQCTHVTRAHVKHRMYVRVAVSYDFKEYACSFWRKLRKISRKWTVSLELSYYHYYNKEDRETTVHTRCSKLKAKQVMQVLGKFKNKINPFNPADN